MLLAQLADAGGSRAPLSHVAAQVFVELTEELERMGVSRRVSADMFGLGARTHRRKLQRIGALLPGIPLRESVLEFVRAGQIVFHSDVIAHFTQADETDVSTTLRELCEAGSIIAMGRGIDTAYRAVRAEVPANMNGGLGFLDPSKTAAPAAADSSGPILVNANGEGTYAVALWQWLPLEHEALDILRQVRLLLAELRLRVAEVNRVESERQPKEPLRDVCSR